MVFETGSLSVWFYHALTAEGLPAICIDVRHAKAALDMAANKTDANDADGLAHLAEVGFYREVRVKGFDSMIPEGFSLYRSAPGKRDRREVPNRSARRRASASRSTADSRQLSSPPSAAALR